MINGGTFVEGGCSASKLLYIGTTVYAVCNPSSSAAFGTFANINNSGGSLFAIPYASKTIINPGQNFNLKGGYSGFAGSVSASNPTYSWSGTGPGGYTYSSTAQNPTPAITLTTPGTYTYTLTVAATSNSQTISNSQTVTVVVTNCNGTTAASMVDNFTGMFHGGTLKDANGQFFVWGENIAPGGGGGINGPYQQVLPGGLSLLPAYVYPVKVSGGSSGDKAEDIVILASNDRIYELGSGQEVLNVDTGGSVSLPDGVTAASVTSFYAGARVVALVAGGKAYVRTQGDNNARGDGASSSVAYNLWSSPVKDQNGNVINNFVSVRGDTYGGDNSMIGFTADNKIYVWGTNIMIPGASASTSKNLATLVTAIPTIAGTGQFAWLSKDANQNECKDSDGDGVPDTLDLDADNDGIVDCVERNVLSLTDAYALQGNATFQASNTEIQLTPDSGSQAGRAWTKGKIDFRKPFILSFNAWLGSKENGADGMAVVFHKDPRGTTAVGDNGEWLGARGIKNGIYLALDTYKNTNDPDFGANNDFGVIKDTDDGSNISSSAVSFGQLENGAWHPVVVTWVPVDANGRGTFTYTVNGIALRYSFSNIIKNRFGGSPLVYFGYTASTGSFSNLQKIKFDNLCRDLPLNIDTDDDGVPNHLDLDSDNDGCFDAVEGGGNVMHP